MGDPGPVVARLHLAELVGPHLREGRLVRGGVVLDRDLRRHAAHRVDATAVAGADEERDVGGEEVLLHRHEAAVGEEESGEAPEPLDEREDVVPAAAVEARRVVAQLPEDLVHLEGAHDRLDEDRGADRPVREAEVLLRLHEDVVPEARLEVVLELREVVAGPRPLGEEPLSAVKEVEAEVEEAPRAGLAVDEEVLLEEVPAARPHDEDRGLLVQPVLLAGLGGAVVDRPVDGVAEVPLPFDAVRPRRRVRVLEVGEEDARPRVEGVDDHLPVDRSGDLDTPVLEPRRNRRDLPVALPDLLRLREEVGEDAGVDPLLGLDAAREELLAARAERPLERGDEAERLGRQDLVVRAGRPDRGPRFLPLRERRWRWLRARGPPRPGRSADAAV